MKETFQRSTAFTEDMVEEWQTNSAEPALENEIFDEPTVPNMMLLDNVSAMLKCMAEDGESVMLSNITAFRFRDPVYYGEQVDLTCQLDESDGSTYTFNVEARTSERDVLAAIGVVTAIVK